MNKQVDPLLLVQDLGQFLQTNSFGIVGQQIFYYTMPTSPVVCRSIFSDGGGKDYRDVMSRPHVQVIVRDTIITSCMAMAKLIWAKLDKPMATMARCQGRFTADHYPTPYRDDNNFWQTSMNFSFVGSVKLIG